MHDFFTIILCNRILKNRSYRPQLKVQFFATNTMTHQYTINFLCQNEVILGKQHHLFKHHRAAICAHTLLIFIMCVNLQMLCVKFDAQQPYFGWLHHFAWIIFRMHLGMTKRALSLIKIVLPCSLIAGHAHPIEMCRSTSVCSLIKTRISYGVLNFSTMHHSLLDASM